MLKYMGGGNKECAMMNSVEEKEEIKKKIISNYIISLYNKGDNTDIKPNSISRHYNLKILIVIYPMILIN